MLPNNKFSDIGLCLSRLSEHQDRSLFDGPFEMMIADFFVAVPGPLAVRFFHRTDQPRIGGKVLHPGKPSNIVNFI